MRKYTQETLLRFHHNSNEHRVSYEPFEGKIPTRLLIKIIFQDYSKNENKIRWSYHGKYSWSAIQTARRVTRRLLKEADGAGGDVVVRVYEYHKHGLLYYGTLKEGTIFYGFERAHYLKGFARPTINVRLSGFAMSQVEEVPCQGMYIPISMMNKEVTALKIHKMILRNRRLSEVK